MKEKIDNDKGVTLVILIVTIVIMMIIAGTLVYQTTTGMSTRVLNNMYRDVKRLKDKIEIYVTEYGELPVLEKPYTKTENISKLNENDDEVYYVIDLAKLDNLTLSYGKGYEEIKQGSNIDQTDVYVVNRQSHNVYYVRGIELEGTVYYTVAGNYTKVNLPQWSDVYTSAKDYTDKEGNMVRIPKGFQVSMKEGEMTVSEGLVIRNAEDKNEFVWIPCTLDGNRGTIAFTRRAYDTQIKDSEGKIIPQGSSSYYLEEMTQEEKSSIQTYGGFYLARYEAGITLKRTSEAEAITQEPKSQRGLQVYNYVTKSQAEELAQGLYQKERDGVQSQLCSSFAWDTTLSFIEEQDRDYILDTQGGNYQIQGQTTIGKETGISSRKNIYDMGGNVWEWTTESHSSGNVVARGGSYEQSSKEASASHRANFGVAQSNRVTGFRIVLYLDDNFVK